MFDIFNVKAYITVSILCFLLAIIQLIFPFNFYIFALCSAFGVIVTPYLYCFLVFKRFKIFDPSCLLAFSLSFGYLLSTFLYIWNGEIFNFNKLNSLSPYYASENYYSYSIALVLFLVGVLIFYSAVGFKVEVKDNSILINKSIILFTLVSTIFIVYSLFTGRIGYQGATLLTSGGVDLLGAISFLLLPVVFITSALLTLFDKKYLIVFVLLLIISAITGRRNLFFYLISIPLIFSVVGYKINYKWILSKLHYFLLLATSFVFLSLYFIALRLASWEGYEGLDIFSEALSILVNRSADIFYYLDDTTDNRTFILSYLVLLLSSYNFNNLPLYGEELVYGILNNVPSFLSSDKKNIYSFSEELYHPKYGIPVYDAPNSIITLGLNDFYIFGVFLYPFVLLFSIKLFIIFVRRIKSNIIFLFTIVLFTNGLLQVEQSVSSFVGLFRSVILFILFFGFFVFLEKFLKKRN